MTLLTAWSAGGIYAVDQTARGSGHGRHRSQGRPPPTWTTIGTELVQTGEVAKQFPAAGLPGPWLNNGVKTQWPTAGIADKVLIGHAGAEAFVRRQAAKDVTGTVRLATPATTAAVKAPLAAPSNAA